jgi:ankyrin repeat protein
MQDQRTAAHVAAADGKAGALQLLLQVSVDTLAGGSGRSGAAVAAAAALVASIKHARDRWGRTPRDEAMSSGSQPCIAMLA